MVKKKLRIRVNHHHRATPAVTPKRRSWQQKKYPRVRALQRYLRAFGVGEDGREGREDFAKRLNTKLSYLVHLGLGYRRASMEMAIRIEQESHGLVRVEEMLPSADWEYLETRKERNDAAAQV